MAACCSTLSLRISSGICDNDHLDPAVRDDESVTSNAGMLSAKRWDGGRSLPAQAGDREGREGRAGTAQTMAEAGTGRRIW
jgi:hypothetical protein